MVEAVEITFSDGTVVQIVPKEFARTALLSIDDIRVGVTITEDGFDVDMRQAISNSRTSVVLEKTLFSIVTIDPNSIKSVMAPNPQKSIMRTCINCNGRSYCMTNGCAKTPCGWVCG